MVQDLWIINEAVVPLHPMVPNPYVILGEILPSTKWFAVLDLKDAFFCIPLAKKSQYLFAFEWEAPGEKHQQITWTVLPQGFRDSPHLFGQALSWDLLALDLGPNGKIFQYIDDLLICSPDEKSAQQHAIQVLNFLAERGYKVSCAKAQMVEKKITYLGVQITHGSRSQKKTFQLYGHEREGIALGVLTQRLGSEPPPVAYLYKRLNPTACGWPLLPLKSCSYCNHDRRCFKTLLWGQNNYFYQPPGKTTPKWERPFMDV